MDEFLTKRKSHCERIIEAIEATIEGRITSDLEEIEVTIGSGTRKLKKIPVPELIKLRQKYLEELNAIKVSDGLAPGGRKTILTRFI